MKKFFLLFTLLMTVCIYVSAKNFYYKGISLTYKGGRFTGTINGSKSIHVAGTIGLAFINISATKLGNEENSAEVVTAHLNQALTNLENTEGMLHVERASDIKDGTLNGIGGQQLDIIYKKKLMRVGQRFFCYIQDDWLVEIIYSKAGKKVNEKEFTSIFKTFNFTPEESGI